MSNLILAAMKKLSKLGTTILFIIFCLTFCTKETDQIKKEPADFLVTSLSHDSDYLRIVEENYVIVQHLVNQIKEKSISLEALTRCDSETVFKLIGLSQEQFYDYSQLVYESTFNLEKKYNLSSYNDAELQDIFNEATPYRRITLNKSQGSCQDQFEADFDEFHANYDSGIIICGIIALRTGLGGLIACNAANVYRTCLAAAEAIDSYYLCLEN